MKMGHHMTMGGRTDGRTAGMNVQGSRYALDECMVRKTAVNEVIRRGKNAGDVRRWKVGEHGMNEREDMRQMNAGTTQQKKWSM
jgi:hypothetical protein